MVTIIRDRIQDLIKKGMTLEQVKAAKPTLDYDGRYGADPAVDDRRCSSRRCTAASAAAKGKKPIEDRQ